jgi:hypothetical protein
MPVQILTPEIISKVAKFHEGLSYFINRDVRSVYEAYRFLKELGLNPHCQVKTAKITKKNWYTGQEEWVYYGSYDFILEGTEKDQMPCNIANYNEQMNCLQFFVNKEQGTFGRLHGAKGYGWQTVA